MRVLLVEDDELVIRALERILVDQDYIVDTAVNGQAGWELVEAFDYDLVVLDIILPGLDGIRFCQRLRLKNSQLPILFLTAQSSSADKVRGLDAGANDYVVKPFEATEILARIRALLRQNALPEASLLQWSGLSLDPELCEVTYNGHILNLTPKEYRLLELFLHNHHRVFSRSAILDHLWSSEQAPGEETVTVHIKDLRQKLKRAGAPTNFIETVYGQGYRLKQLASTAPVISSTLAQSQQSLIYQQTRAGLAVVWERYKELSFDRLHVLEQATEHLLENQLELEQQRKAQRAAHKLAGALGIFGFTEASRLARELEEIFAVEDRLAQAQVLYLTDVLATLRGILEQSSETDYETNDTENLVLASAKYPLSKEMCSESVCRFMRPLLLMIDDDLEFAHQIISLAKSWGLSIVSVPNLLPVQDIIDADVIVLMFSLAGASKGNLERLTELANQIPPLPVLFLTAQDDLLNRLKVLHLSAHAFLQKSLLPEQVLAVLAQVRSRFRNEVAKVMIVDDDPKLLAVMRTLLEPLGLRLITLENPFQFWQALEHFTPDLLILDVKMPNLNGIELCQLLRSTPQWRELPILFLTIYMDGSTISQVLAAGANDCISKTVGVSELVTRILNRLERVRLLRAVASSINQATSLECKVL
jgi:DNA-binding response OmpR family regulator/HPt (histidine-containing phosphotransfer) domain-containing protein